MIALHIAYENSGLLLWSEGTSVGKIKDLKTATKAMGTRNVLKGISKQYYAWLPTKGSIPLPSSPLIKDIPYGNHKTILSAHLVETIPLNLEALAELLLICRESDLSDTGCILGTSVFWIANLFTVALDITIKGLFLPSIQYVDNCWEAHWIPLPDEENEKLIAQLTDDMPPAVKCLSIDDTDEPVSNSGFVTKSALGYLVDYLIRNKEAKLLTEQRLISVHDAWINALTGYDARIKWENQQEIRDFARQFSDVSRQLFIASRSQVKLCFRLSEPATEKGNWRLEYLLQSKNDPGLLIPYDEIWNKKPSAIEYLAKNGVDSFELPLMLLGQAACIYSGLKTKAKTKLLSSMELSTAQALSFLMYYADIIVQSGFSLLLPAWWKGKNTTSGLSLSLKVKSPAMQSNAGMTLNSILEYDYRACIGTEDLSVEELNKLAKLKTPLVQIRGQWTYVNQEQIAETLKFLHKQQTTSLTGRDLVKIALGTQISPIPLERVSIDGWVSRFYDELTGKKEFRQLEQPKHFSGKLRHYQEKGYSWLAFLKQWGLGACLADDMGLGKTVQALALLQSDREAGEKRPVLLICPTTVINNWLKEAARFTPEIKTLVHHGLVRQKSEAFIKSAAKQGLVISSFGLLHRDLEFINQVNWAGVIVDEAQNIKNPQTMQAKAVRTLKADYRIAMTGTPVENHVGDLWAIMDFLNPGLLGSAQNFKMRFHKQITLYQDKPTVELLKKITSPFILRRLKTDKNIIKDLPDKIENKEYCTLTKEQASLYQAVADEVQSQVENADGIARKGIVLAAITRLKQVCNHPAQYAADNSALPGRSGKLERLLEILYEIQENNEKTLIFTQYAEMGAILKKALQDHFGKEVLFLHGTLSKKKRDELVERFQTETNAPGIFILSLKAGGTGLTLTQANHVIHYDRWWNPAVENQATDRAFRIGQKKNVQVHKFIVAGTLEDKIDMLMEKKAVIATSVVGSGETWLSELSNDDFRKLIALSKTALGE